MNYRHVYHAGNFADVLKHAVMALVLEHLKLKPSPFRVVDTHAGLGSYDLSSPEAQKTGEWRDGIGRLLESRMPPDVDRLLQPYLAAVRQQNGVGEVHSYPGSPLIARQLLRPQDQLVVNELHPEDGQQLARLFAGDPQTKVLSLNGWDCVKSLLPPKERRGLTLIDPPFEEPGEFGRLEQALREAHKRFATGTVVMWYPIKDDAVVAAFHDRLSNAPVEKLLSVILMVRSAGQSTGLLGSGLVISNPPFTLAGSLEVLLPFLSKTLAQSGRARSHLAWLKQEKSAKSGS